MQFYTKTFRTVRSPHVYKYIYILMLYPVSPKSPVLLQMAIMRICMKIIWTVSSPKKCIHISPIFYSRFPTVFTSIANGYYEGLYDRNINIPILLPILPTCTRISVYGVRRKVIWTVSSPRKELISITLP